MHSRIIGFMVCSLFFFRLPNVLHIHLQKLIIIAIFWCHLSIYSLFTKLKDSPCRILYFSHSANEMSKLHSVLYFPSLILLSSNIYFHLPSNLRFYDHNSFVLRKNNSQWIITDLRIILSYLKFCSRSLDVRQKICLSRFSGLTNIWLYNILLNGAIK